MYYNTVEQFGFLIGILLVLAVGSGLYLLSAYVLWRIGRKCRVGTFWTYCIPFYNFGLMCRWIGVSSWASAWFAIPLLAGAGSHFFSQENIAAMLFITGVLALFLGFWVYFWGNVALRLGKSFWLYGITSLLFGISILFLAFDESAASDDRASAASYPNVVFSLFWVSGEQARRVVPVPVEGLYIGRNPAKANLVLHSSQISNVHARVWPDPRGSGLWVKDWNSLNGTFYHEEHLNHRRNREEWVPVRGQVLLNQGARFRLGADVAEFEVSAS